jgi:hypothetical protein
VSSNPATPTHEAAGQDRPDQQPISLDTASKAAEYGNGATPRGCRPDDIMPSPASDRWRTPPFDPSGETGSGLTIEDYSRSILRSPCVGVHHSTTSTVV